ncbi:MAG: CRTAC1 family protein [Saprospiraceae bacterium]|nr:CRTAC1 family protein [Saprospiraceae bacterium]
MSHKQHIVILSFVLLLLGSCNPAEDSIFINIPQDQSDVDFSNDLIESSSFNILSYLYFYNGGGVALGDINKDGWIDIFFTANQGPDKLFLNKGNLKFEDISVSAGISQDAGWSSGVTMVDVNEDGLLDIYVCRLGNYLQYKDRNRLYINQGDNVFKEEAERYGLDFSGFSTHAAFFDYDRDGDLDCYLLNHSVKRPEQFSDASITRYRKDSLAGDLLLRNDSGQYNDVTDSAGIFSSEVGFGLGLSIGDFNNDHWLDIYVGNDFHENDYLYINNHDGTFREVIELSTGHTSNFTMGVDAGDINQDGLLDIMSLDMQPGDETTYKNSGGWENYEIYRFKRRFDYHHQSPKNAVQINKGVVDGVPRFSEIAGFINLMATDWSWSPLIEDYDGDGDMDIFISNGIVRRPNDMDFVNFYANEINNEGLDTLQFIQKMPQGFVPNILGINNKNEGFTSQKIGSPGASTGAAYGDLDNDGDLDLVVNNINELASILVNQSNPEEYTTINLVPSHLALGSQIKIYKGKERYYRTVKPVAGFQSTSDHRVLIPSPSENIDSIVILWSDGNIQHISNLKNGDNTISYTSDRMSYKSVVQTNVSSLGLGFIHKDVSYNDQTREFLQPIFCSTLGPKMDRTRDRIYVSGGKGQDGVILNISGEVIAKINKGISRDYIDENDAEWLDLEGDGDLDLYIATGGNELKENNPLLADLIFINEGGEFMASDQLSPIYRNSAVVKASDWDQDGDTDLFIGVNGITGSYGNSSSSYILVNQGGEFSPAPIDLNEMVQDAEWVDLDGDGDDDLVVVGMWMPVTIFINQDGKLGKYSIPNSEGWWFDVEVTDVNGDAILDILAGNFGINHRFRAEEDQPLRLYINDFDNNGKEDPILTYMESGNEYIYPNLELLLKQLPGLKKEFVLNKDFAGKTVKDIFDKDALEGSVVKLVHTLKSAVYFQEDIREWKSHPFPSSLQSFPITAIEPLEDGRIAVGGNYHEVDPNLGKQDAGYLYSIEFENNWKSPEILSLYPGQIRDIEQIDNKLWVAYHTDTLRQVILPIKR